VLLPGGNFLLFQSGLQVFEGVDLLLCDHDKEGQIDRVNSFAEDGPLTTTLASLIQAILVVSSFEEGSRALKVVALHEMPQRLTWRQGLTIASVDVTDLALGDGDKSHFVDAVLPTPQSKVHSTSKEVRLIASFALESQDRTFGYSPLRRP
jgi:hypothetical protein